MQELKCKIPTVGLLYLLYSSGFILCFLQPAHPLTNSSFAHLLKALLLSVTSQNHMIYLLTIVKVEPLGWAWAGSLLPVIFLHINTFFGEC